MRIGVPKEIKVLENRVGLMPGSVREAVAHGHEVVVEHNAGQGIGMDDDAYRKAGATIVATAAEVFAAADMIVKVKEPQAVERAMLRPGPDPVHLPAPRARSRAGEGPRRERRRLHRVRDGHLADAAGCRCSRRCPRSPGGWPCRPARITSRSRTAGSACCWAACRASIRRRSSSSAAASSASHAIHIALGMGADVWVLDRNVEVLRALWRQFGRPLNTVFSTQRRDRAPRGRPPIS